MSNTEVELLLQNAAININLIRTSLYYYSNGKVDLKCVRIIKTNQLVTTMTYGANDEFEQTVVIDAKSITITSNSTNVEGTYHRAAPEQITITEMKDIPNIDIFILELYVKTLLGEPYMNNIYLLEYLEERTKFYKMKENNK